MATLIAVSGLFAPGCIIVADDDDNLLVIENNSDFFLDEIFIAEDGDASWGPNLAGPGLEPGGSIEVELDCGFYDLRVVDEEGVVCEVFGLDLCLSDEDVFVFENRTCDVFEAALKNKEKTGKDTSGAKQPNAASAVPETTQAPLM